MRLTRPAGPAARQARRSIENQVDELIRLRIQSCPYAFMFDRVRWKYDRGILTLEGAVQSFYLREMLEHLLRDVEYLDRIVNRVDVVNPTGLSSVRQANQQDGRRGNTPQRQPSG